MRSYTIIIVTIPLTPVCGEVLSAEIVFVGYGIQAPEYQWDDIEAADLRARFCS